jgi:hypothetical protein
VLKSKKKVGLEMKENNFNLVGFKVRDMEEIETTLKAFCMNFNKGITIYKRVGYYKGDTRYYIYVGTSDILSRDYIYMVDNLEELKGWLYGMVQANNGYLKAFKGEL